MKTLHAFLIIFIGLSAVHSSSRTCYTGQEYVSNKQTPNWVSPFGKRYHCNHCSNNLLGGVNVNTLSTNKPNAMTGSVVSDGGMEGLKVLFQCENTTECSNSYFPFHDSCYKIHPQQMNRENAAAVCAEENGHLIDITSMEEQDFISKKLSENDTDDVWIGLKASELSDGSNSLYVWTDSKPLGYQNWDKSEKAESKERKTCVQMKKSKNYSWKSVFCYNKCGFVCEMNVEK